jgi:hypothetical protein
VVCDCENAFERRKRDARVAIEAVHRVGARLIGPLDRATAEENNPAALAKAMSGAKVTLEAGLKASEREGKPISAKFEVEDGKLELSVYAAKDKDFVEVVVDPATAATVKTEKITGGDDLKDANIHSGSMATATQSLQSTTDATVKANAGFRAVSVVPDLKNGRSVAVVTLLQGTSFKTVTMPLD